jgi:hypothetical protein
MSPIYHETNGFEILGWSATASIPKTNDISYAGLG